MSTRITGIVLALFLPLALLAQGGDQQLRAKADALFKERRFAEAMTMYSQLVSLTPSDRELNFRFGTCLLHSGEDKEKAISYLKYATDDPAGPSAAWYWLGRAYHLNYRFKEAQMAYQRFRGTGDKKALEEWPVEGFEQQCRNGEKLLSSLKDVRVRSKVEAVDSEFFRFYELGDIGGRIVVTPEELRTALDKKSGQRGLIYLPDRKGPIYFSSLGKDGRTGRDIYRTELMPDGTFATPIKLAGYINTDLDEDFPFLHPDGKTFYFSSKGHNSMGGFDVFRTTYDRGLDAFGRPENLDFAVNTPDDDIFYVVDGEHQEACFASGRSSAQGKLHVYRVSTSQVPVVITVLKGTFANQFDKDDRKAHIVVEDALTRETVADVRTDINGSYVLSLPRSGRFRFLVECGPTGRTHAGMVEVPRNDGPRAYRQELDLTDQGGQERLVIRNYFDEPLGDDIVALALDEIKRRARLDVSTGNDPVAQPEAPAPVADVLTAAGFTGDVDKAAAQRIADEDALAYEQEAAELERSAKEALAIALAAVEEATAATAEAEQLINSAQDLTEESARNARMTDAARTRQRAREAGMRARAAQRTADDLAAAALTRRQRAAEADRIATNVRNTLGAGKDQEALPHLVALRTQHETRTGPNAEPDAAERARRAVTAQREEAERALRQATSKREEENELTDRVNRLKREQESTGNKNKKAELQRSIDELDGQLSALRDETRAAQAKALTLERESAVLRGQAALTALLATPTDAAPQAVPEAVAATLPERIREAEQRANALPIDERFEALLKEPVAQMEARVFNWELHSPARTGPLAAAPTNALARTIDRAEDTATPTRTMGAITDQQGASAQTEVARAAEADGARTAANTASTSGQAGGSTTTGNAGNSSEDTANAAGSGAPVRDADASNSTAAAGNDAASTGNPDNTTAAVPTRGNEDTANAADAGANERSTDGNTNTVTTTAAANTSTDARSGTEGTARTETAQRTGDSTTSTTTAQRGTEGSGDTQRSSDVRTSAGNTASQGSTNNADATAGTKSANDSDNDSATAGERQAGGADNTSDALANNDGAEQGTDGADGEQRFLLENERAELSQALPSTRDRNERTRIEQRLAAIDSTLVALEQQQARNEEALADDDMPAPSIAAGRTPLVFTEATSDERIIDQLFADNQQLRANLERLPDADERAEALNGFELMIADSIKEEMAAQLAVLELDPAQAPVVLPRVERLRQLREGKRADAERHLAERREAIAAAAGQGGAAAEDAAIALRNAGLPPGEDPIRDRFVAIAPDQVLASTVQHRSAEVREAVAEKERDLGKIEGLSTRIDSLNELLMGTADTKQFQRIEKQRDRLFDERYMLSTELGQRSAFLTKSEWRLAQDSLKTINRTVSAKGLAADEPLLVMAQGYSSDAERAFNNAAQLRKQADRTEDIVQRDTLYKQAYAQELEALRDLDRAITVQNYLGGDRHARGEALAYEAVAARVLGLDQADLLAAAQRRGSSTKSTAATTGEVTPTQAIDGAADTGNTGSITATATDDTGSAGSATDTQTSITDSGTISTTAASGVTTTEGTVDTRVADAAGTDDAPDATVAAVEPAGGAGADATALIDGDAEIRRAEARLRPEDRIPPGMFEEFLRNDAAALPPATTEANDISALNLRIENLKRESEAMQRLADERVASAEALAASAVEARKRERERLEAMVVREREIADSLRAGSVQRDEEADRLLADLEAAKQQLEWRERLLKFYYLTPEDQQLVYTDSDESRYFQMRSLAIEQGDAAAEADRAAKGNREVAQLMRNSALEARQRAGADPNDATLDQISRLETRAGALMQRADSLDQVAVRLRSASDLNLQQASVLLQGMDGDRATELQAMETRARRSDAVLANIRETAPVAQPIAARTPDRTAPSTTTGTQPSTATAQGGAVPASSTAASEAPTTAAVTPSPERDAPIATPDQARADAADPNMRAFRLPEELVEDLFELRADGAERTAPILMDAAMPEGIVFKVQIGAFRKPVSEEAFSDMTPVMGETVNPGLVRYTAGLFTGFRQAADAKDKVRSRGYTDAFVVAYRDGKRIPLGEAMRAAAAEQRAATAAVQPTAPSNAPASTTTPTTTTAPATTAPVTAAVPPANTTPAATAPVVIQAPAATAPADDASVLARYPASADEVLATFAPPADATAYYNVPGAAPATQVETVRGLFYTVQVGVYSRPVALDKLFNITPLNSERTETAKVRYTTGIYTDMDSVRRRREEAVTLGVKDAFITAYLNGKRIPMREAALLIEKFGPAILAKP
jgi:hypothetical protein